MSHAAQSPLDPRASLSGATPPHSLRVDGRPASPPIDQVPQVSTLPVGTLIHQDHATLLAAATHLSPSRLKKLIEDLLYESRKHRWSPPRLWTLRITLLDMWALLKLKAGPSPRPAPSPDAGTVSLKTKKILETLDRLRKKAARTPPGQTKTRIEWQIRAIEERSDRAARGPAPAVKPNDAVPGKVIRGGRSSHASGSRFAIRFEELRRLHLRILNELSLDRILPPVRRFSWQLLPPGEWNTQSLLNRFNQLQSEGRLHAFDESRIIAMCQLQPRQCYMGMSEWDGYIVFEFSQYSCVVLECPEYGNATYVLNGNWKELTRLSKGDLLRYHGPDIRRIEHREHWADQLQLALRHWPAAGTGANA